MQSFARRLGAFLAAEKKRRSGLSIFNKFNGYSMVPMERYFENLQIAELVNNTPGVVVECGVWRGGMIAGIACVLGNKRHYHLFDSFEGLPAAKLKDGQDALAYQKEQQSPHYFDNCSADSTFAEQAMEKAKAKFTLHKGWFNQTLPDFHPKEGIALLRLDGDWYDSTLICLKALFPLMNRGGIVLIDDYFNWDGCTLAVHDYLSEIQMPYRLQTTINGVCFLQKK